MRYSEDLSHAALVMSLADPYLDSGRNLTVDNYMYFTSNKLAKFLNTRRTSLVGTLKKVHVVCLISLNPHKAVNVEILSIFTLTMQRFLPFGTKATSL